MKCPAYLFLSSNGCVKGSRNSTNWTLPNQSKSLIKFGGSPTNTVLIRQLTKFFEQIKNINYRKSTNFFGELKISIVT